jgi:predicted transglutaminase-like cysteine proteinase
MDWASLAPLAVPDWRYATVPLAAIGGTAPTAPIAPSVDQADIALPAWLPAIEAPVAAMPVSTPVLPQWAAAMQVADPSPPVPSGPTIVPPTVKSLAVVPIKLLKQVNRKVNGRVRQKADDKALAGGENWQETGTTRWATGDCEDIALQKRRELLEAGFAPQHLFLAVAFVRSVGLHTVLVGRTETGDFVLDSMTPYVTHWSKVGYSWLRIQSGSDPMDWRLLGRGVPVQMAALTVGTPPGGGQ